MREIKFRGMSATGIMRYGRLSQDKPNETAYYKEFSQRICWDDVNNPVRNETLGQYTGLKDKNGKEIYERDIVDNGNGGCVVFWNNNYFAWWVEDKKEDFYSSLIDFVDENDVKIIGNIFETPELLQKG